MVIRYLSGRIARIDQFVEDASESEPVDSQIRIQFFGHPTNENGYLTTRYEGSAPSRVSGLVRWNRGRCIYQRQRPFDKRETGGSVPFTEAVANVMNREILHLRRQGFTLQGLADGGIQVPLGIQHQQDAEAFEVANRYQQILQQAVLETLTRPVFKRSGS